MQVSHHAFLSRFEHNLFCSILIMWKQTEIEFILQVNAMYWRMQPVYCIERGTDLHWTIPSSFSYTMKMEKKYFNAGKETKMYSGEHTC